MAVTRVAQQQQLLFLGPVQVLLCDLPLCSAPQVPADTPILIRFVNLAEDQGFAWFHWVQHPQAKDLSLIFIFKYFLIVKICKMQTWGYEKNAGRCFSTRSRSSCYLISVFFSAPTIFFFCLRIVFVVRERLNQSMENSTDCKHLDPEFAKVDEPFIPVGSEKPLRFRNPLL